MTPIYDIAINLGCALLSFVFGVFAHKALLKWKQRGKMVIWNILKNGNDLSIAITMRDAPHTTSTPRVALAEVLALADIFPILQQLSLTYNIINDNKNYRINNSSNLLCIGGQRANAVTAKLFAQYGNTLPIKIEDNPFCIEVGNKKYFTEYSENNLHIIADYGVVLVICSQDDMGKSKCRIAAFGGRGFGTRGALQCLSSSDLVKRFKRYSKNSSFLAIIRISGNTDEIQTSVIDFYPLDAYI